MAWQLLLPIQNNRCKDTLTFIKARFMKFFLVMLFFPVLVEKQCNKQRNRNDSVPTCVWQRIEEIKKEPKWNPPAQVDEYIYNGRNVFLFSSNCCDQYNMLYSDNCITICAPSGGIAGHGDQKCNDFFNSAKYIKLVWKDPR